MITAKEIESLFREQEYDKASQQIKMDLLEQDDPELLYYLFLAENGDYVNIDLNDIKNEIYFNKAISQAVLRLKSEFTAEYNFYKAVDINLRKYFNYASRGNVEAFGNHLASYGLQEVPLICDSSDEKEFFSNLDYLVTSRVTPVVMDLNLLALNILYISTKCQDLIKIWGVLKERTTQVNTCLSSIPLYQNIDEIRKAYESLIHGEKIKSEEDIKAKEEKMKLEEQVSDLKKQIDNLKDDNKKMEDSLNDANSNLKLTTSSTTPKSDREKYNERMDRFARNGRKISIIGFCLSFVLYGICLAPIGIIFGCYGRKSDNRDTNGSKQAIIFGCLSDIVFWVVVLLIVLLTTSL